MAAGSLGAAGLCLCLRSYRQQLAFRANRLGAGLRIYKTSSEYSLSSVQQWRLCDCIGELLCALSVIAWPASHTGNDCGQCNYSCETSN